MRLSHVLLLISIKQFQTSSSSETASSSSRSSVSESGRLPSGPPTVIVGSDTPEAEMRRAYRKFISLVSSRFMQRSPEQTAFLTERLDEALALQSRFASRILHYREKLFSEDVLSERINSITERIDKLNDDIRTFQQTLLVDLQRNEFKAPASSLIRWTDLLTSAIIKLLEIKAFRGKRTLHDMTTLTESLQFQSSRLERIGRAFRDSLGIRLESVEALKHKESVSQIDRLQIIKRCLKLEVGVIMPFLRASDIEKFRHKFVTYKQSLSDQSSDDIILKAMEALEAARVEMFRFRGEVFFNGARRPPVMLLQREAVALAAGALSIETDSDYEDSLRMIVEASTNLEAFIPSY